MCDNPLMKLDENLTPAAGATAAAAAATATATAKAVAAARWAISTIFLLNGAGIGLWAAHVPLVQARAGIDTGVLGLLLLTIAGGALSSMPLSGWLAGRWGTRPVVLASAWLLSITTALLMNVGRTKTICRWLTDLSPHARPLIDIVTPLNDIGRLKLRLSEPTAVRATTG